jgi:hypothetical protein
LRDRDGMVHVVHETCSGTARRGMVGLEPSESMNRLHRWFALIAIDLMVFKLYPAWSLEAILVIILISIAFS